MKKYYQSDVDEWVQKNQDWNADGLLDIELPTMRKRLDRVDRQIRKLLTEIQETFPDAQFYTSGGDGFALILGDTHDDRSEQDQQQRSAWMGKSTIGGGDW